MNKAYEEWNNAIGRTFFGPDQSKEPVVLAVDEAEVFRIARASVLAEKFNLLTPRQASDHFCSAVRHQVEKQGWRYGECGKDEVPAFLAILAFFVLAAFRMEDGTNWSRDAYWIRVWDVYDPTKAEEFRARRRSGECFQVHPPFERKHEAFRQLWESLETWANQTQGGEWGWVQLPTNREGAYSSVGLIKSQALLRRADLANLPFLFARWGLRPGDELSIEELRRQVTRHQTDGPMLSAHAHRVLADENRREAALGQIARRLKHWSSTPSSEESPRTQGRQRRPDFDPWREPGEPSDPVRLVGGLKLNRQTWMAGAGPTVLVDSQLLAEFPRCEVWINGACWTLEEGRLGPLRAPILDQPGRYEIKVGDWRLELGRLGFRKLVRMSQVLLQGELLAVPCLLDDGVDALEGSAKWNGCRGFGGCDRGETGPKEAVV